MKIKVLTSYKPGTWKEYAKRAVDSVVKNWPEDTTVAVYHESQDADIFEHPRVQWVDVHQAQPELVKFKNKWKDDPVANGEIKEIPNGMRRPGPMPNKGSYQWNAVRFANKVFCVTHALNSSEDFDYVVWLDADTYTFRPMPKSFLQQMLPENTMLTYLGRENPDLNDGGRDPECGFVGYNMNHSEIKNFSKDWEEMYVKETVFKLTWGWTDCSTLWHLSKLYQKEKGISVNDIGYGKKVKGNHVFINSELGLYMDHFKGKRKQTKKSAKNDFRPQVLDTTKNLTSLEYWKKI